jgi:PKD repeat protein
MKMMKRILFGAYLWILFFSIILVIFRVESQEIRFPTFWIKIYRIQKVDDIEGFLEGGADWHYYISVWDGEKWLSINDAAPDNHDDIVINKIYSFTVKTVRVSFHIELLEDDFWSAADVADISGYAGGGYDNYRGIIPRGARYEGTYDLKTNTLSGDKVVIETGYYKTSGDYDGSVGVDENDANLWFDVWDNYDPPKADAGPDQTIYTGEKVNFDGSASKASAGSSIVKYEWDFDNDGIIDAEGAKTSYTYTQKGQFTAVLKVTDSLGQVDTDTCIITVLNRPPVASFTYTPFKPTIKDDVKFVDTSLDSDGSIVSWFWDFGDGITSTDRNPTHKYSSKGNFTVTLTVTDNDGAQGTITKVVTIYNIAPTASFKYSPSEPTVGEDVQFVDESTDPEGKLTSWLWNFGDGYTSTIKNPTHKYQKEGTYNVTLTVTDDEGLTDTTSKILVIKALPLYKHPFFPAAIITTVVVIVVVTLIVIKIKRKRPT